MEVGDYMVMMLEMIAKELMATGRDVDVSPEEARAVYDSLRLRYPLSVLAHGYVAFGYLVEAHFSDLWYSFLHSLAEAL